MSVKFYPDSEMTLLEFVEKNDITLEILEYKGKYSLKSYQCCLRDFKLKDHAADVTVYGSGDSKEAALVHLAEQLSLKEAILTLRYEKNIGFRTPESLRCPSFKIEYKDYEGLV